MRILLRLAGVLFLAGFTSCAAYKPLPLSNRPNLASGLASLKVIVPAERAERKQRTIDIARPLTIEDIGLLAVLNDPDLRSEQGEMGVAEAELVQASLLPNPSASLGYAALIGGPASLGSYAASLSQDIGALVTYKARLKAARAHAGKVNADLLWREWQVAQKARVLALDIYWAEQSIGLTGRRIESLTHEVEQVQKVVKAGNLDITALSPLLAEKASTERALSALRLDTLKKRQELNALLGLVPDVRFAIAAPAPFEMPSDVERLIADLPGRRPDLVALQLGYRSSDQNVRAAVLGQFPAFVIGGNWGSDTSAVRSAGPTFTFDLPIFNRNQGRIARTRATCSMLHEQYQARLDSASGNIRGLMAQAKRLSDDLASAGKAAAAAKAQVATVRRAYARGNIDQRTLADYETTAFQREREVIDLKRSLGEDRIGLTIELGLGLPKTRIVSAKQEKTQ